MRSPRGFTLIELMMTVAIVGLLGAVAIPNFVHYQFRSRQAERAVVMRGIHEAVTLLVIRDGRFPNDVPGGGSSIDCPENPAGIPSTFKRQFDRSVGDWSRLSMTIEGALYHTYQVTGVAEAGARHHIIVAIGDLDGDAADPAERATMANTYTYVNGGLVSFNSAVSGGEF